MNGKRSRGALRLVSINYIGPNGDMEKYLLNNSGNLVDKLNLNTRRCKELKKESAMPKLKKVMKKNQKTGFGGNGIGGNLLTKNSTESDSILANVIVELPLSYSDYNNTFIRDVTNEKDEGDMFDQLFVQEKEVPINDFLKLQYSRDRLQFLENYSPLCYVP